MRLNFTHKNEAVSEVTHCLILSTRLQKLHQDASNAVSLTIYSLFFPLPECIISFIAPRFVFSALNAL